MNWMGIDGGGSTLRVVIVDDDLSVIAQNQTDAANPNTIGHDEAARRIRAGVVATLKNAGLQTVVGVGVGIAGASARHSADWLESVMKAVLPESRIVPSSDEEIALVGARGRLDGVVLLAGTGSAAYGVGVDGRVFRAGGWGYLLGDEGAGYWIGQQALKAATLRADGRLTAETRLPQMLMARLGLHTPDDLIGWMYRRAQTADVAALAADVVAMTDDAHAIHIIDEAAAHLAGLARHVLHELHFSVDALAFAGSLLTTDNALSARVCARLGLARPPLVRYPPAIGAALLAKIKAHVD